MGSLSEIKTFIQFLVIIFTLTINFIFILLVLTESPKKLGNYKYLMCYFSIISMIFSFIDFLVQPYLHSHGASYGLYMDLRENFFEAYPTVAFLLAASLTGCFAATIYSIAINFVYRFFALEREGRLRYFSKKRLVLWVFIPILVASLFILNNWFFFSSLDKELTEYSRTDLKEQFDLDIDRTIYIACLYWRTDMYGNTYLSWKDLTGSLVLNNIMSIALCIIMYFGTKSYYKIRELISQGESEYSKRLQTQLYYALVAQTIIPLVFLFIPVGSLIYCPLFGFDVEWASLIVTFLFTFYPLVDPIPTIFLVDEYRNAFCNFFRRALSNNQVVSVVSYDLNTDHF